MWTRSFWWLESIIQHQVYLPNGGSRLQYNCIAISYLIRLILLPSPVRPPTPLFIHSQYLTPNWLTTPFIYDDAWCLHWSKRWGLRVPPVWWRPRRKTSLVLRMLAWKITPLPAPTDTGCILDKGLDSGERRIQGWIWVRVRIQGWGCRYPFQLFSYYYEEQEDCCWPSLISPHQCRNLRKCQEWNTPQFSLEGGKMLVLN